MNILLTDGLPVDYEGVPISPDFRNMLRVGAILQDPGLPEMIKTEAALDQLYPQIPDDTNFALEGLEWFFLLGDIPNEEERRTRRNVRKAYDFEKDSRVIFASFVAAYGINLADIDFLHWWEFMALFDWLPEDTPMRKLIYYRTVDVSKMSKEMKNQILELRKTFALDEPAEQGLSIDEIEHRTKSKVEKRFEEARRLIAGREGEKNNGL